MKRRFLLLFALTVVIGSLVSCDTQTDPEPETVLDKTVTTTAGNLLKDIGTAEALTIKTLRVKGTIDARDFKQLRSGMMNLSELDLSEATIAAYNGIDGCSASATSYKANTLPTEAFCIVTITPNSTSYVGLINYTSIILPSSITEIGDYALFGNNNLTSIIIPPLVTTIGKSAFNSCNKVTSITCSAPLVKIGDNAFESCTLLSSFTIPNTVISIGAHAFSSCTSIKSFEVPASVTSIGNYAFNNCSSLTSFKINKSTPLPILYVFLYTSKTACTLYVPTGSKASYKAAMEWRDFTNIVEF